jgi:hypothetical protein
MQRSLSKVSQALRANTRSMATKLDFPHPDPSGLLPIEHKASIRAVFHPVKMYAHESVVPSLTIPLTDENQWPEGTEQCISAYEEAVYAVKADTYKRQSADMGRRTHEVPTVRRQRLARQKKRRAKEVEIHRIIRKALDSNPRYSAVQKAIVKRETERIVQNTQPGEAQNFHDIKKINSTPIATRHLDSYLGDFSEWDYCPYGRERSRNPEDED